MARKAKTRIKRRAARAQPSETTTSAAPKVTSQRDLRALMEACINHETKAASAMGNSRELVGEYVRDKNLHPQAFGMTKRLVRLGHRDPGALWLLLAYLDDYREKLGLDKLAKEQGQMLASGADEGEEETTNVRRMVPREVEEAAGAA